MSAEPFHPTTRLDRIAGLGVMLSVLGLVAILEAADPPEPPVEAEKALETIHIRDGFVVEMVAAEPMVADPVAIAWGADGRLWVAEMADYPSGMDGKGKPGGRVRFLEDSNGDGKYDRSTVFAEELRFPTGVLPWRDGVLVTAAPEILFLRDTDDDGKADEREVLFKGFHEGNQQLRVNGLQRGLDNWIYCASGSHHAGYGKDARITSTRTGESIQLGSRDFRFHPETGAIEPLSGPSQFGRNRDEWGNWFGSMNSHPIWHYVLEDAWLQRNPHLKPPDPRRQLILPRNPRVYPAKAPQKRFHSFEQTGRFTSSCGGMIYRDELLFPREEGKLHAFACEPFHNLVQHIVAEEDGFSFKGQRDAPEGTVDFFASTDRWCRPVSARTGPDGALWIVDMYRYIIEHSQWLPETGKKELAPFLRSGDDRGRIYRVYPKDQPPREIPKLSGFKPNKLLGALGHPSGQVRDLAQEILVEEWGEDSETIGRLSHIVEKGENPTARLHALFTLDGIDRLRDFETSIALTDEHSGVRRNAIRLFERIETKDSAVQDNLATMVDDPNTRVRLQLAATLGRWPDNEVASDALAKLAVGNAGDPHFDAVVLSSTSAGNIERLIESTLAAESNAAAAGNLAGRLLALSVALGKDEATLSGLRMVLARDDENPSWKFGMVAGLLDALKQHRSSVEKLAGDGDAAVNSLNELIREARRLAGNESAEAGTRKAAFRLMARSNLPEARKADIETLGNILTPATPPALQSAAVGHLATLSDPAAAVALLSGWKSHGPGLRAEILGVIPTRREWVAALLDEIETGRIPPGHIGPFVRKNLTRGADKAGKARLAKLFADSDTGTRNRKEIVAAWKPALDLEGDRKSGAEIFKLACAACHQLDGVGQDIGPNLASLSDRRPIALFTAILDPNAQLDARYSTYVARTKDDRSLVGFLAAETANSITLKGADNVAHQVLRTDLKSLESTGLSLMPEGLEAAMDHQKLADLLAYLATAGLPKN